jgi:hypothetical protein
MKIFILSTLLISSSAMATCIMDFTKCSPNNNFQNSYELRTTRCSPPGGPVHKSTVLTITNKLVGDCTPRPYPGCLKPLVQRELNTTRHNYLQADIKMMGRHVFIRIDDRRFLPQGEFHISTPKADYMLLPGYTCVQNGR